MTKYDFKPADLRGFVARDWALPRRLQNEETADLARRFDWTELLRRSDELRDAAGWLAPGWPNAGTRQEDLDAHRRLAQKLATFEARRQNRAAVDRASHEATQGLVVPLGPIAD